MSFCHVIGSAFFEGFRSSGAGSHWNRVSFFSVPKSNLILDRMWKSCGFQRFLFKIGKEPLSETPKVLRTPEDYRFCYSATSVTSHRVSADNRSPQKPSCGRQCWPSAPTFTECLPAAHLVGFGARFPPAASVVRRHFFTCCTSPGLMRISNIDGRPHGRAHPLHLSPRQKDPSG